MITIKKLQHTNQGIKGNQEWRTYEITDLSHNDNPKMEVPEEYMHNILERGQWMLTRHSKKCAICSKYVWYRRMYNFKMMCAQCYEIEQVKEILKQ